MIRVFVLISVFVSAMMFGGPANALSPCSLIDKGGILCGLAWKGARKQLKLGDRVKGARFEKQRQVKPTAAQRRKYGQNATCYSTGSTQNSTVKCRRIEIENQGR